VEASRSRPSPRLFAFTVPVRPFLLSRSTFLPRSCTRLCSLLMWQRSAWVVSTFMAIIGFKHLLQNISRNEEPCCFVPEHIIPFPIRMACPKTQLLLRTYLYLLKQAKYLSYVAALHPRCRASQARFGLRLSSRIVHGRPLILEESMADH